MPCAVWQVEQLLENRRNYGCRGLVLKITMWVLSVLKILDSLDSLHAFRKLGWSGLSFVQV